MAGESKTRPQPGAIRVGTVDDYQGQVGQGLLLVQPRVVTGMEIKYPLGVIRGGTGEVPPLRCVVCLPYHLLCMIAPSAAEWFGWHGGGRLPAGHSFNLSCLLAIHQQQTSLKQCRRSVSSSSPTCCAGQDPRLLWPACSPSTSQNLASNNAGGAHHFHLHRAQPPRVAAACPPSRR